MPSCFYNYLQTYRNIFQKVNNKRWLIEENEVISRLT